MMLPAPERGLKTRAVAAIVVAVFPVGGGNRIAPTTEFVGTIPCAEAVRAFVGGIAAGAPCASMILRIDLGATDRNGPGWALDAAYGSNNASTAGMMPSGSRISLRGRLERSGTTYRLISDGGKSISFRQVSSTLIHLLDERNRLMLSTAGWSYTLNRADSADDTGRPEQVFGASYSLQPRATGGNVLGVFAGRTPCTSLLRTLRITLNDGCQRIKWRVTLFQDSITREPTMYRIEGSLHHAGREGLWRIVRGTPQDPNAVVYQLDATASEGQMLLLKAEDDVLFLLDERKQPLVGTIDFSYTLNRSP
jgi:hypothetical protein